MGNGHLPFVYYTPNGNILAYVGGPQVRPVLTVELYPKWYGFWLVMPDGSVRSETYEILEGSGRRYKAVPYVDHVPNAELVPEVVAARDWILDDCAYELMVGRWELEVVNPTKYDL